jgi:hypothetical protein
MRARITLAVAALALAASVMPSASEANGYHRRHVVAAATTDDCFGIFTRAGNWFGFLNCTHW